MRLALIVALTTVGWLPFMPRGSYQDVLLQGRVTDAVSGTGISGVVITVGTRVAHTGATGSYELRIAGTVAALSQVTVRARLIGYVTATQTVPVSDSVLTVDFSLTTAIVSMDEMVVEGEQNKRGREFRAAQPAALRSVASGFADGRLEQVRRLRTPLADPGHDREGYAHIIENVFQSVAANPLSTFSIDVDRASYSNIRRFINDGQRPPIDAVRIEELINYFPYDYPAPNRRLPFSVTTEVAVAPWNPIHQLVRIGVQGRQVDFEDLPPNNLVFLLDVSGSMNAPNKLPLLKSSFRMLVNELRPQDRVAIVVYAGAAGLVLPSTSGAHKARMLEAIDRLQAGGSTAGGAGIQLAYRVARDNHLQEGNNRVILATDGDFNVGASSDSEMIRLIEEKREQGTFLTVLGFGTGNLQDAKMEQIADHGNGNFAYIDNLMEARKVLVNEAGGTLLTIAKDVKIQVEFNPTNVQAYRLVGYENRLMAAEDFNDDKKDAGELGAGHSVTALYEIILVGVESDVAIRGVDSLRYQSNGAVRPSGNVSELGFVKLRYKSPTGVRSRLIEQPIIVADAQPSSDFRFASAVAGFGMLLRNSQFVGRMTLDGVLALAQESQGSDDHGYRSEFVGLVRATRELGLLDR